MALSIQSTMPVSDFRLKSFKSFNQVNHGSDIFCQDSFARSLANKQIKSNLSNAARSAIQNDPELRLYYDRKAKEEGTWGNDECSKI
jgi:hypothetical protein